MQRKIAPYLSPTAAVPLPPHAGGGPVALLPNGTLASRTGKRSTRSSIRPRSKLPLAQATDLPELYTRMLEERRTTARIKALLEDIFCPINLFSLELVQLRATNNMAKELTNLNYGYHNDLSCKSSHWGISPFAVIRVSMATASRQRRQADGYTHTSNLTLAEVTMADTNPGPIPTEYHGTANLLRCYTMFLQHIVGPQCTLYGSATDHSGIEHPPAYL
jgi:hypothetical protein